MATRDTSVNLVLKARNEADRAINSVTSALTNLFSTTENGQQKINSLTGALAGIDKAASTIAGAADKGEAAFNSLGTKIAEQRRQLESLREQATQASAAIAKLSSADAIVGAGRDQSGRLAQLKAATDAYDKLEAEIRKIGSTLAADESRLNGSRSALQQLGSTAIAAADGQARLRAEIELETQALREQALAAERVTSVQARINAMTGVNRQATFDGSRASQSAEILAEAAARDALIQKYKQQATEARQLAEAEAAEQANRRRFGITDDPRGAQASQSAAVFQAQADAADLLATETKKAAANERELDVAAQRLRDSLRPQAALQKQFNDQIREAIALRRAEKITTEELRDRITQLRAGAQRAQVDLKRNGGNGVGIFGLRPYEVTNLGYQINDLVTQVASGTSVTQALAQQGGQILQILPQIGTRLIALATNPAFLVLAAGAATLVVGLKEVGDQAERARTFTKDLGLNVDGGVYDPQKLNASAEALMRYGLSAKDAVEAVRLFVGEGVDSSSIERFGKTASDLAEILGVDVKQAAQIVADGFDGTYESVRKLDERFNFLTAAQRDYIEEQFRLGNATTATNYAFDLFSERAGKTAEDARGPWSSAFRELGNAWSEFKQGLADTAVFKAVGNAFATMAGGIARDLRMLRGAASIADLNSKINEKADQIAGLQNGRGGILAMLPGFRQNATRQLEEDIRKLEAQRDALVNQQQQPDSQINAQQQERTRKANEDLAEETRRNREKDSARTAEEVAREKALADLRRDEFKYADQATKQAYVDQKVQEARTAALKKAADEREREARAAKAAAEEQRRGYIRDIQDNGREGILSTARRFDGQNAVANNSSLTDFFRKAGININPAQTAWCAAFVNAVLASQNLPTSKGPGGQTSLAARSFLNYGQDATSNPQEGDIVVLRRGNNNAQGHVGFFQGFDENGNVKVLGGNQSNGVNTSTFNRDNVLAIRRAPTAAQVATDELKAEEKKVEQQTSFNDALDVEARKRELNIASANTMRDLTGEALIDAQKAAAVEEAVRRDREKAAKDDLTYTKEQEQRTRRLAEAEFEATRGVKERADVRKKEATEPVDQLVSQRKSLQDQLEAAQRTGDVNLAGRLADQIQGVNTKLQEAIDKAIRFWQALGGPEADAAIAKLQGIKQTMGEAGTQFLMTGRQINESIANGVAGAFDNFAKNVAEGKNVFKSLRDAFLQFAADFLRQIAQMIIKQAVFNLISGVMGGGDGSGGAGGGIAGAIGGMFHNGGVVGEGGGQPRAVNPAWFAAATRYHTGGIAGLAPDEMPAVLRKGEEVLTRGDPRHRANGGASGGAGGATKIVNVFDAGQAAEEILRTPAGEKAMLNFVSNNRDAFKAAIGG